MIVDCGTSSAHLVQAPSFLHVPHRTQIMPARGDSMRRNNNHSPNDPSYSPKQSPNTSKTEPLRIAYVQLPSLTSIRKSSKHHQDDVLASIGEHSPSKRRKLNSNVTLSSTKSQPVPPQASLLGLPAELRNRIYEHIWPGDLIHVATRPCKPYDKGAWRTDFNQSSWAPQSRFVRWTHTICQVPDDWQRAYARSRRPDSNASKQQDSLIQPHSECVQDSHSRHSECHRIQESFVEQQYVSKCAHKWHPVHDPKYCDQQHKYVSEMTAKYGEASTTGLEALHSTSKLHLNILLTCRQLYNEAALLPYALSTWQFDYPSTIESFSCRMACESQIAAIKNLRVDGWPWSDTKTAMSTFTQLQRLEYSCSYSSGYCGRMKIAKDMLENLRHADAATRPGLKEAEVIFGTDAIPKAPGTESRSVRREQAEEAERWLTMRREDGQRKAGDNDLGEEVGS